MMLKIGVGYAPRTLSAPQAQPAQGFLPVVASDDASVPVRLTAITVEVSAPSAHAGSYPLVLADLARGPVCLVAPAIKALDGVLTAAPGLWAHDPARGPAAITRQWMAGEAAVEGATGPDFASARTGAAQDIVLAETVRQNGVETVARSAPFVLPAQAVPGPASLSVSPDATLKLVVDPAGTATVEIVEPKIHAGTHALAAAQLKDGPLWLVPARIQGSAQVGGQLSVAYRGLHVSDADAGPVALQGQWQRDGLPIPGALAETYGIQAVDAGRRIAFLETATNSRGTRRQASNEIAIGGTS